MAQYGLLSSGKVVDIKAKVASTNALKRMEEHPFEFVFKYTELDGTKVEVVSHAIIRAVETVHSEDLKVIYPQKIREIGDLCQSRDFDLAQNRFEEIKNLKVEGLTQDQIDERDQLFEAIKELLESLAAGNVSEQGYELINALMNYKDTDIEN